ncbi:hypothetical protein L1887_11271 [Cichorium endivia]|nr:hypothetical protein L1887_11271 [Cichorium endivia]
MRPFDSQDGGKGRRKSAKSSGSSQASGDAGGRFSVKQAATSAALALTDRERWVKTKALQNQHLLMRPVSYPTMPLMNQFHPLLIRTASNLASNFWNFG